MLLSLVNGNNVLLMEKMFSPMWTKSRSVSAMTFKKFREVAFDCDDLGSGVTLAELGERVSPAGPQPGINRWRLRYGSLDCPPTGSDVGGVTPKVPTSKPANEP